VERLIVPLALVAMGLLVFVFVGDSMCGGPPPEAPAQRPDAMAQAPHRPLPRMEDRPEPVDAGVVVDAALTVEAVQRIGLLGRDQRWLAESLSTLPDWKPVPDAPRPTWEGFDGVQLSFDVDEKGRVIGAEAVFSERALSASLTALSQQFVGNHDFLKVHMEVMTAEEAAIPRQGSFEDRFGRTVYYRGTFRTEGEGPYGPANFEVSRKPFPPNPEAKPAPGTPGIDDVLPVPVEPAPAPPPP
jgi:hypothetical protein